MKRRNSWNEPKQNTKRKILKGAGIVVVIYAVGQLVALSLFETGVVRGLNHPNVQELSKRVEGKVVTIVADQGTSVGDELNLYSWEQTRKADGSMKGTLEYVVERAGESRLVVEWSGDSEDPTVESIRWNEDSHYLYRRRE